PISTLFPYTTLFRSLPVALRRRVAGHEAGRGRHRRRRGVEEDAADDGVGARDRAEIGHADRDVALDVPDQVLALLEVAQRLAVRSEEHTSELQSLAY